MTRGTTPTEVYELDTPDLDMSTLTVVWITIRDERDQKYTWDDISRMSFDNENKTISITFTQEETLAFVPGQATVDIRALTADNKAIATDTTIIEIHDIQKDGVIA